MNRRNMILLVGLLVLLGVFLLSRQKENIERRKDLFRFKAGEITRIEFTQFADTLMVARVDGAWMVEHPRLVPARETQVTRFLNEYLTLSTSRMPISDSRDRQAFYQVDEDSAIQIAIFGRNNRQLSRMFFGMGQNHGVAYIRAANNNNIFQIDNVFSAINPHISVWREDRIVQFAENQINSVSVARGTEFYQLAQEFGSWSITYADSTHIISPGNSEFRRFMNALTGLRTNIFFDNEYELYETKLETPELTMLVDLITGESIWLIMARNDENSFVLQRNQEYDTLYRLTNQQFNQLAIEANRFIE